MQWGRWVDVKPGARILDVGSAESTFPLSAASLGYKVTAIDPRPLPYSHPNLESHAARFEEWDAPSERFAAAFLISTIEHVGLRAYGERAYGSTEHGEGADLELINRVRELLAPDGILVLTTPYGQRVDTTELERIYDEESSAQAARRTGRLSSVRSSHGGMRSFGRRTT